MQEEEKIYKKINYRSPIKYFINTYIREYDLSKANISSLYYTGRITKEKYNEFMNIDKQSREIKIGLMIQKDNSIYHSIQKGIIEAKKRLVESNQLTDFDILSIKNDAIFVIAKNLKYTQFPPYFEFKLKNTYNIYLQLLDLEIYYGDKFNTDGTLDTNIDVKGISDDKIPLHLDGILGFICDICFKLQRDNIEDVLRYASNIYNKYINRELPKEFYREFDSSSMYMIYSTTHRFVLEDIDDSMISSVDIGRNLLILRDLMTIITDIYNHTMRRMG